MPEILVDFSQVQDTSIPKGKYLTEIEQVEVRQGEGKEHPYLNWQLTIIDGEYQGRKLWFMTSLSPKSLWKLKPIFKALGYEEEQITLDVDETSRLLLAPDFTGKHVTAEVEPELYQGVTRARVVNLTEIAAEQGLLL
jgi:hypothetical protein